MKKIIIILPVILFIAILSHIQVNADYNNHQDNWVMLQYKTDPTIKVYIETTGNITLKATGSTPQDYYYNSDTEFRAWQYYHTGWGTVNYIQGGYVFAIVPWCSVNNYEIIGLKDSSIIKNPENIPIPYSINSKIVLITSPTENQVFTDKSPDIKYKIYGYDDVTIKFYNSNGTMYHEHSGLCAGDSEQTYLAEAYNSYPGHKATEVGKSGFNGVNTVKFYDTATGNLIAQRSWTNNIEFSVTPPTPAQSDFYYVKYAYPSKDGQKFAGGNNLINTTVIGRVPIDLNKYKLEQIKFEFKGYLRYGEADTPTITKHDGYIEFGISANGEPVAGENKKFQFILTMPNGTVYTAERIYTYYTDFVDTNNDGKDDRTGDQQVEPYTPEVPSKPMDIWDWIGKLPTILSNAFNAAASCVVLIGNLGTIMTTTFGFLPIGISSVLILGCMLAVVLKLFAR